MSPPTEERRLPPISLPIDRTNSPQIIYLTALLFLICAVVTVVPRLQRDLRQLVLLRNLIESAAAPGEPVLVDNWLLYHFLRAKGSLALRGQLMLDLDATEMPPTLSSTEEIMVVSTERSPLCTTLRSHGYSLISNAAQTSSITSGNAITIPGRGPILIHFAAPTSAPPVSSQHP